MKIVIDFCSDRKQDDMSRVVFPVRRNQAETRIQLFSGGKANTIDTKSIGKSRFALDLTSPTPIT